MNTELLLVSVFAPVILSFTVPLIGLMSRRLRNFYALILVLIPLIIAINFIPDILNNKIATYTLAFPLSLNISFSADGLAVFMAIVSSFISAIIVIYSWGYISHYENQDEYYLMVVLFLGSMIGICYSANLILLYIFWEITAVTSWRLIGFLREPQYVLKADKAFIVTMFGALAMLIGFIMIYQETGSFDIAAVKAAQSTGPVSAIALGLILAGILSKSATLPFHTWLPDAGVAPSPVTALLHAAVLVKIGVYVYARLFVVTFTLDEFWHTAVPVIAAASTIVSAGAAVIEKDIKRIIAYSTISQIGFIFLGLSTGSEIGIAGAILYILMHGISKAGLFLCAGIIEQNTHKKDITEMGGLYKTMPVTAVSFLLCAFSVMGVPPFGGFFSKYMVIAGAVNSGHTMLALVFILGGFMTIIYLYRVFNYVFLKDPKSEPAKEGSPVMVASVALLGLLSVLSGVLIYYPSEFAQTVVKQMLGIIK